VLQRRVLLGELLDLPTFTELVKGFVELYKVGIKVFDEKGAKLADIKVGEAILATGPDGGDIIITRPTETTVAAYSAICTHEGCTVRPAGKELDCPCHGSIFDLTGAVLTGPAQRPLRVVKVALSGDDVIAG
jgi:Rieske Fe-S protein